MTTGQALANYNEQKGHVIFDQSIKKDPTMVTCTETHRCWCIDLDSRVKSTMDQSGEQAELNIFCEVEYNIYDHSY